jgi:hypothetical protein
MEKMDFKVQCVPIYEYLILDLVPTGTFNDPYLRYLGSQMIPKFSAYILTSML